MLYVLDDLEVVDPPQLGIPPWPWPDQHDPPWAGCPPGDDDRCLGDVGTVWTFKMSDLDQRLTGLGIDTSLYEIAGDYISKAIELMSRWTNAGQTCDKLDDDEDPHIAWISGLERPEVGLYTVRVGIHGTLTGGEEVLHTQHLVKARNGTDMSGLDAAALVTLGGSLKTTWNNMMTTNVSGEAGSPQHYLSNDVAYDEFRVSLVEYLTAPAKPVVHVPTQVIPNSPTVGGAATNGLPYEVACCLTLLTTRRDRSCRGRVYLPPFGSAYLAAGGLYTAAAVSGVAKGFATNWISALHTGSDYDVVVVSARGHAGHQKTGAATAPGALGVGGVVADVIPDSMRTRRKNLNQARTLYWGSLPTT